MSEQKVEERLSSADIKKQIEAKKEELKISGRPLVGGIANEINASESTPEKTSRTEVKTEPVPPASKGVEVAAAEKSAEYKEWAKKKGIDWTTDDNILKALHMSDQQFHEKRTKEKKQENVPNPYVPYVPPQPVYAQPAPNRAVLENLARQYNMPAEDIERLMNFNRDFFEAASVGERNRIKQELESVKRENQKNSVFRELSSDPVFRQPDIAMEFYRVVEEMQSQDPQSFEEDPKQYVRAFDKAQVNVFRRNLEGQQLQEGIPPQARELKLPTTPPRPSGQGSGGGAYESETSIDSKEFAKLTLEDKKKMLEGMGLRSAYQ